ncbi:MAG: helix-hairpin-helix domain-containing protein [Acidobacteriota bacterium]|jgi:hypothetical protein
MKIQIAAVLLLSAGLATAAQLPATVPCEILIPVLDAGKTVVTAIAPDGRAYPVFRPAPAGKLVENIRTELGKSFAQQVLRLDRYARNLVAARPETARTLVEERLAAPMYLLMSAEEGGFARFGFWLEDAAATRKLVLSGYVDLVVSQNSVETGDFEEIFSHELGHLILKALTGGVGNGPSRKMHQSMSVTDYPTAFDEGYAEHFQPLARDATTNAYLRKLMSGVSATDFELFWLSAADGQLRTDGVKRNLFIHRKPLPAIALDPHPDMYRLFIDQETSTAFLPTELKNGQEMMASEGIIATLFYRIVNDDQLRKHYLEPSFYQRFLGGPVEAPAQAVTPYENVNLKLFAAMETLRSTERNRAPMINLVEQYAKLFPDEAKRIYAIFIETTWGATVSQQLASGLAHAAAEGARGDIAAFRQDHPFPLLDSTIAQVVERKIALDASLGSELWVANTAFKIAPTVWGTKRSEPLTMNLNTASVAEWMSVPGVDLRMARKIIAARDARGVFRSLDQLREAGVPSDVIARLREMQVAMAQLGDYKRE